MRSVRAITGALAGAVAAMLIACSTVDAPVGEARPDNSVTPRILFDSHRSGTEEIYVMDPDGSNVRQLTRVAQKGITSTFPDWSPDRKRIVFSSDRPGPPPSWNDLYVMDADGGNVRQLTDTPEVSEGGAAWSPDGRHVAYHAAPIAADGRRQNAQLWIIDADGSNARALTSGSSRNRGPAWSPDGSTIAFTSDRHAEVDINLIGTDEGDVDIYIMDRDGSNVRRLTDCASSASGPNWSPDGQRIAFGCGSGDQPPRNLGLHVMSADGSNQRLLIKDVFLGVAWSPDGERIAYNCNPADPLLLVWPLQFEQLEICVIRVDGSDLRILTENEVFDGHPDWW